MASLQNFSPSPSGHAHGATVPGVHSPSVLPVVGTPLVVSVPVAVPVPVLDTLAPSSPGVPVG
jgi:hypothetical protein